MPSDYKNSFHWMVYGHTQENRKVVHDGRALNEGYIDIYRTTGVDRCLVMTNSHRCLVMTNSHKGRVYGIINPISALVVIVVCLFLLGHRDLDIGILLTSLTLPHFCACPKP